MSLADYTVEQLEFELSQRKNLIGSITSRSDDDWEVRLNADLGIWVGPAGAEQGRNFNPDDLKKLITTLQNKLAEPQKTFPKLLILNDGKGRQVELYVDPTLDNKPVLVVRGNDDGIATELSVDDLKQMRDWINQYLGN